MGHASIATMAAASQQWQDVVGLISNGADVAKVADATLKAAEVAFALVSEDVGFREAAELMAQIPLAACGEDANGALAALGIELSEDCSTAELAMVVGEELDRRLSALRCRSDFGEIAGKALIAAVLRCVKERSLPLLPAMHGNVTAALQQAGTAKGFGEFARSFFERVTAGSLDYFLTRTLGTHVGSGQRFATNNQMAEFMQAMRTHCRESSEVVRKYSEDWFEKHRDGKGARFTREEVEGYAWFGMKKIRELLAARARENEN